jgi:hypothetical protein
MKIAQNIATYIFIYKYIYIYIYMKVSQKSWVFPGILGNTLGRHAASGLTIGGASMADE